MLVHLCVCALSCTCVCVKCCAYFFISSFSCLSLFISLLLLFRLSGVKDNVTMSLPLSQTDHFIGYFCFRAIRFLECSAGNNVGYYFRSRIKNGKRMRQRSVKEKKRKSLEVLLWSVTFFAITDFIFFFIFFCLDINKLLNYSRLYAELK